VDGIHPDELGVWRFVTFLTRKLKQDQTLKKQIFHHERTGK